jgi:hypothetical protein
MQTNEKCWSDGGCLENLIYKKYAMAAARELRKPTR